jgi:hypothetical protein
MIPDIFPPSLLVTPTSAGFAPDEPAPQSHYVERFHDQAIAPLSAAGLM